VPAAAPHPQKALLDRQVDQDDQVGPQAARGQVRHVTDRVERQPAPVSLVGQRGFDVAVADHQTAGGQARPDHLGHVLGPVGEVEERLGLRNESVAPEIEQDLADRSADDRAAGLLRDDRVRAQSGRQPLGLRALAAALHSLERDESHTSGFYQWGPAP